MENDKNRITCYEVGSEEYRAEMEKYRTAVADAKAKMEYLPDLGVIRIRMHEFYEYDVDMDLCKDMVDICRCIFHFKGKGWMTEEMLRRFAKLACEANGFGNAEAMPWRD
ncbi:hypothetical protein [Desulfovibrio porci]|uniref:hypothetical protein n=1 Tax=Desulfovibrio porci TaxID=2605782 RepID=UPI003A93FD18